MVELENAQVQMLVQFIRDEVGEVALRQVRTFLEGGEPSTASNENRMRLKNAHIYLKKTTETRKFASQICNITAGEVPVVDSKISTIAGHIHRYEERQSVVGKTTRQVETLTRTSLGSPQRKTSKVIVERRGVSYQLSETIQFTVGDILLVWWTSGWYTGMVKEIGGEASLAMKIQILGRDELSCVWISESEWSFRVRQVATPTNVCLSKGYLGRTGEEVRVKVVDPLEEGFWKNEYPVAVVLAQVPQFDSVKVEVNFLAYTETMVVPNFFIAPLNSEIHKETVNVAIAARVESCRLIDAYLAGARLTNEKVLTIGREGWSKVWQGTCNVSGLRVLACVMRQGGQASSPLQDPVTCKVRVTDPITRVWRVSVVPQELLKEYSGLDWSTEGTEVQAAAVKLMMHARIRIGKLEWDDETLNRRSDSTPSGVRACDACLAMGQWYPETPISEPIGSARGLLLKNVEVDVFMHEKVGGGFWEDDLDGVRLVVEVKYSEDVTVKNLFCIFRQDWQSFRPFGVNGGSLPGMRCMKPSCVPLLLKYFLNRLHVYEGSPVLRFPHRSAYPLGFIPFQAKLPPNGEAEWSRQLDREIGVVWRASICLHDGVTSNRWNICIKSNGPSLDLVALPISRKVSPVTLYLSLSVKDWGVLGFGPRQWLNIYQQQLICRRLLCRHSKVLMLHRISDINGVINYSLSCQLQPVIKDEVESTGKFTVKVRDVGSLIEMELQSSKSSHVSRVWLSSRDLHSCCPSLQLDTFADTQSLDLLSAPVALGPYRACFLRNRKCRPGITKAESASDLCDLKACWEELRMNSALRDMEPLARLALFQRLIASLELKLFRLANQDEESVKSCPPHMPSSLVQLQCEVIPYNEGGVDSFSVKVTPPVSLGGGAGTLESFHIRFQTEVCIGEEVYTVKIAAARRGITQKAYFTAVELGECLELWQSPQVDPCPRTISQVKSVISKLQEQAGAASAWGSEMVQAKVSIGVEFAPSPLALFIHQVNVNFVRNEPLTMRAFDTGSGVLLLSSVGSDSRCNVSSSLRVNWQEEEEGELGRYLVPRAEMGENREPLLMNGLELDRLMLGFGRKGQDRRSGETNNVPISNY